MYLKCVAVKISFLAIIQSVSIRCVCVSSSSFVTEQNIMRASTAKIVSIVSENLIVSEINFQTDAWPINAFCRL